MSEEFIRLISENVSDLIAVLDTDGRRIYNSPSYCQVLGGPLSPSSSDSFEEIHPEDPANIRQLFREVASTGKGQRAGYRFRRTDGEVRHVESQSNVITDPSGNTERVVVVSRDVSARVQTANDAETRHPQGCRACRRHR